MLSAIEIYNKPNFSYREETYAILAINSFELLLKAQLLKISGYKMEALYVMEPVITKSGLAHRTKRKPKLNRAKNPQTLGLIETIKHLEASGYKLTSNMSMNLLALLELRDSAIHFHNDKVLTKEIQELGFANIKNYINIIKIWDIPIDLSLYNFYLMPLAYVDSKVQVDALLTDEMRNYLNYVKAKLAQNDDTDEIFDIAISIDINFKKSNSFESIGMFYDPDGLPITLSEEDIRSRFSLTYSEVCDIAKSRYSNFVQNMEFNTTMREIKYNTKLYHERKLDIDNPKSSKKPYFSTNIWQVLDAKYKQKEKVFEGPKRVIMKFE
ncbi:MAG: DUF3644 domain-containing protein [Saprospiraceae bacterium]|nr:DUF3644 domain-containing protein [Saprospiraceae bacterium]